MDQSRFHSVYENGSIMCDMSVSYIYICIFINAQSLEASQGWRRRGEFKQDSGSNRILLCRITIDGEEKNIKKEYIS